MGLRSASEKRIRDSFTSVGISRGEEFYIPRAVADRYIAACADESVAIIGIEVFRINASGKLIPILDQIADFSSIIEPDMLWASLVRATNKEALYFVEQVPTDKNILLNFSLRHGAAD